MSRHALRPGDRIYTSAELFGATPPRQPSHGLSILGFVLLAVLVILGAILLAVAN